MIYSQMLLAYQFITHMKSRSNMQTCLLSLLPEGLCLRISRLCSQSGLSSLPRGGLGGWGTAGPKLQPVTLTGHLLALAKKQSWGKEQSQAEEQKERIGKEENECYIIVESTDYNVFVSNKPLLQTIPKDQMYLMLWKTQNHLNKS